MPAYVEEEALTKYISDHYSQFLTTTELMALKTIRAHQKASATDSEQHANMIRRHFGHGEDPTVVTALEHGTDAFMLAVRNRIVRDHKDELLINRRPECQRIVRTPRAQQCFWCGHDWHTVPLDSE